MKQTKAFRTMADGKYAGRHIACAANDTGHMTAAAKCQMTVSITKEKK